MIDTTNLSKERAFDLINKLLDTWDLYRRTGLHETYKEYHILREEIANRLSIADKQEERINPEEIDTLIDEAVEAFHEMIKQPSPFRMKLYGSIREQIEKRLK